MLHLLLQNARCPRMNHGSPERGDRRHSPSNLVRVPKVLSEIMYENQAARKPVRPTTAAARVGARAEISALTREVSGSPARRRKGKQDTGQQELNATGRRLIASASLSALGHRALTTEMAAPAPTPTEDVYNIFKLAEKRKGFEVEDPTERRPAVRSFPPTRPPTRSEVHQLAAKLDEMLERAGPRTSLALQAWDVTFAELVRQVFLHCSDRGELLGRVRRAYSHYVSELVRRVRQLEATEQQQELLKLREENARLRERLAEAEGAGRRASVVSRLAIATAKATGERQGRVSMVEEIEREKEGQAGIGGTGTPPSSAASGSRPPGGSARLRAGS